MCIHVYHALCVCIEHVHAICIHVFVCPVGTKMCLCLCVHACVLSHVQKHIHVCLICVCLYVMCVCIMVMCVYWNVPCECVLYSYAHCASVSCVHTCTYVSRIHVCSHTCACLFISLFICVHVPVLSPGHWPLHPQLSKLDEEGMNPDSGPLST